jgi:hypothetical protein
MTVLIMSHSEDNDSVDAICRKVEERGHRVLRIDTDRFPTEVPLATRFGADGESHSLAGVPLAEVTAVWNRRYFTGRDIPNDLDAQLRQPSVEESRRSVFGLIACLDVFQLDPLRYSHFARHKPLQLKIAQELGLAVPETVITNDPEEVRALAARCPDGIVTKMMSSFAVYDDEGREQVVFTNRLSAEQLNDLDGLELAPMTFQESVAKEVELRITVVGNQVFTAAIDPGKSQRAANDWRRDGIGLLEHWAEHPLPDDVADKLLRLCDRLGLNYGAIDVIITPDGRHVFLEINPVGEFFWLEKTPGFPITDAITDLLVDPSTRRLDLRNPTSRPGS